jgi:hypothetical protein
MMRHDRRIHTQRFLPSEPSLTLATHATISPSLRRNVMGKTL